MIKRVFIKAFIIALMVAVCYDHNENNPRPPEPAAETWSDGIHRLGDDLKRMVAQKNTSDKQTNSRFSLHNLLQTTFYFLLPMWIGIILAWIRNIGRDEH